MLIENIENLQVDLKSAILKKLNEDFPDADSGLAEMFNTWIDASVPLVMQYIVDNAVVVGDKIE